MKNEETYYGSGTPLMPQVLTDWAKRYTLLRMNYYSINEQAFQVPYLRHEIIQSRPGKCKDENLDGQNLDDEDLDDQKLDEQIEAFFGRNRSNSVIFLAANQSFLYHKIHSKKVQRTMKCLRKKKKTKPEQNTDSDFIKNCHLTIYTSTCPFKAKLSVTLKS